jgi:hypothetical protein
MEQDEKNKVIEIMQMKYNNRIILLFPISIPQK